VWLLASALSGAPGAAGQAGEDLSGAPGAAGQAGEDPPKEAGEKIEPRTPEAKSEADQAEAWYDRIELRGDLRLRYEGFHQEELSDTDRRDRFRLRIRPGIYAKLTEIVEVGFQIRSGDPMDPVSDNQSLDGAFSKKEVSISEGFVSIGATRWMGLTLGKFDAVRKWAVSDMQWDEDVTVEGAMEEISADPFEANLYQYVLEERGGSDDAYLIGGQVLAKLESRSRGTLTAGVGYDHWLRPQLVADLTMEGELHGNEVTNLLDQEGRLVSDFRILNAFVSWSQARFERWPVAVHLYGYHNAGARGLGKEHDYGYYARVQVGDHKKRGQLMLRYTRYYSEPDALFYVFAQSDTSRGSDVDGHRFDVRIGAVKKSYFNLTWYHTQPTYADEAPMDRWQVDYIVPF
jgi:hypothetical protein